VLLIFGSSLIGCTTTVLPPADPFDPVTVHLTDYGKHSSVLLPNPRGGYDEWAFGDWDYFAQGNTGALVAIRALLGSPQSTLGRRHIPEDESHESLQQFLGASRLMSFQVSRERADSLRLQLDARFGRNAKPVFYSDYSNLFHVRDDEFYWGGNNCNHVTAVWLRQLGCKIEGPAIFSNFVLPAKEMQPPRHGDAEN
jgi:hypothetical protein